MEFTGLNVTSYTPLITDGLVLYLDAAKAASYPGSGSTWYDLSGSGNNMTLYNSPTFTSNVLEFNGTNQYGDTTLNLSASPYTVMAASRYSGATRGRTISSMGNNWLLGHWVETTENYYAEGWISSPFSGPNDTDWRIYTGTGTGTYSFYVNNVLKVSNSNGAEGPNQLSVSRSGFYGEYSTCQVSFVMAYNRVLTETEMTTNFNFFRSRFGL
jgi:hypothetical protein